MLLLRVASATLLAVLVTGLAVTAAQAAPASHQSARHVEAAAGGSALASALLEEMGSTLAKGAASKGFEFALAAMGIGGDAGTAAQLAAISKQLERVNEQLTTLRNETTEIARQVNQSDYNSAAREAAPILNSIEFAEEKLRQATLQPAGTSAQKKLAEEAKAYIGANLLDKITLLEKLVGSSGAIAPTSIIAAGWHVRTADNFVTHQDSVELRYLIDYYTAYEAEAVQLVVTYYTSDPDYPLSTIQSIVDRAKATVASQLQHQRDVVPVGTVVDARSRLMWATNPDLILVAQDPASVMSVGAFGIPKVVSFFVLANVPQQTGGLTGWMMPSREQMQNLVKGWNGRPDEWLAKNAGFPSPLEKGEGSQLNPEFWTWTVSSVFVPPGSSREVKFYYVMNMRNGEEFGRDPNGSLSQHGYLLVRGTNAGAYTP